MAAQAIHRKRCEGDWSWSVDSMALPQISQLKEGSQVLVHPIQKALHHHCSSQHCYKSIRSLTAFFAWMQRNAQRCCRAISAKWVFGNAIHACDMMQICASLWKWCINKDTFITNLGDWCLTSTGLQANAPSNKYNFVSRASDYMLTHFKLFSEVSCSISF